MGSRCLGSIETYPDALLLRPTRNICFVLDEVTGLHPFEDMNMPHKRCHIASLSGQGADVCQYPLQCIQVSVSYNAFTCMRVQADPLSRRPLQQLQVPPHRSPVGRARFPFTTVRPRPLENF